MAERHTRADFESSGGTTIAAYRWLPETPARAVVQLTHGMGEHALRYDDLAGYLTERGYAVYAQDHRGHGRTATSDDELGRIGAEGWTELVADIDRLRLRAREEHPDVPLVLLGHSMGSFAAQQYVLDHSGDIDALVLTGTAVLDLLEPSLDLDQPLDLSMFNAPFAPARTDYDWLSRDEAQVDRYVADPRCGFGLDGVWSDDFHHAVHTLLTGESFGYYEDYGQISHLAKAYRDSFVYDWSYSQHRQRFHGAPTGASAFPYPGGRATRGTWGSRPREDAVPQGRLSHLLVPLFQAQEYASGQCDP